jgi:ABC-type ATPase with predicted acetyltransferase domain
MSKQRTIPEEKLAKHLLDLTVRLCRCETFMRTIAYTYSEFYPEVVNEWLADAQRVGKSGRKHTRKS